MSGIQVNRADIDSFTPLLAGLSASPVAKELLSSIVTAIRDAIDEDGDSVTVIPFDTAFTPDEAPAEDAAEGVRVTVAKVGKA